MPPCLPKAWVFRAISGLEQLCGWALLESNRFQSLAMVFKLGCTNTHPQNHHLFIYQFHPATDELLLSRPIGPLTGPQDSAEDNPFPPSYAYAQPTVLKLHQTRRNPSGHEVRRLYQIIYHYKLFVCYTNWMRYNMARWKNQLGNTMRITFARLGQEARERLPAAFTRWSLNTSSLVKSANFLCTADVANIIAHLPIDDESNIL